MQAIGSAGALSKLVHFRQLPTGLAAAQRIFAVQEGAPSCTAIYHGHIRSLNSLMVPLLRKSDLSSFFPSPFVEPAFYSTISSRNHKKRSSSNTDIRAAVSSRAKPSTKSGPRPNSKPSSEPGPDTREEGPKPKQEAPWLVARNEIKRKTNTDKKTKKQEMLLAKAIQTEEVDMFGVPLKEARPPPDGMKVKEYEPSHLKLKTAEFVISSTDVSKCPDTDLPEFAVVGRSNVGKSSLINMLTNRKSLAMTSKKPGECLRPKCFVLVAL
jgi:hypothetical protein